MTGNLTLWTDVQALCLGAPEQQATQNRQKEESVFYLTCSRRTEHTVHVSAETMTFTF